MNTVKLLERFSKIMVHLNADKQVTEDVIIDYVEESPQLYAQVENICIELESIFDIETKAVAG